MKRKINFLLLLVGFTFLSSFAFAQAIDDRPSVEQITTQSINGGAYSSNYSLTGENLVALIEKMGDFSKPGSAIVFNRWTGQVFVKNTQKEHQLIDTIISTIRESQSRQVEIEARIMTVRGSYFSQKGLDFAGLDFLTTHQKTKTFGTDPILGDGVFSTFTQFQDLVDGSGNPTGGQFSFTALSRRFQISTLIDFLDRNGELNTLAAPKLTVFNNQRAHIKIAQAESYIRELTVTSDVAAQSVATEMEVDVAQSGTVLDVVPTINRDGTITLEIHPQFVTADLSRTQVVNVAGTGTINSDAQPFVSLPVYTNQSIDTTVTVEDGGVLVLGGLIEEFETNNLQQVPGVSKVPLVGNLFKNKKEGREKVHLVIFLRARTINQGGMTK